MVSALTNARLYVESMERLRLQEEVNMARQIQVGLLPSKPPDLTNTEISVHSTPSRTVGGDFYDFIKIDENRIGIVIADASGKGMPAALMIAQIQAIIHSEVNNGNRIETMLKNMNQQVAQATSTEKYVTLFYGELDNSCANGEMELLKTGGAIIGALPKLEFKSSTVKLESDDLLFLFTDGLSEAMDQDEKEYGENRIRNFICGHRKECPDKLIDSILSDVRSFDPTYPPRDDTTIIALKMNNVIERLDNGYA